MLIWIKPVGMPIRVASSHWKGIQLHHSILGDDEVEATRAEAAEVEAAGLAKIKKDGGNGYLQHAMTKESGHYKPDRNFLAAVAEFYSAGIRSSPLD